MQTETAYHEVINKLLPELKWRNDYQKSATDGKFLLIKTTGEIESKFSLYDENDNLLIDWNE